MANLEKYELSRQDARVAGSFGLSPREVEVLSSLADGLLYKEVADKLGVGFSTVHKHVNSIYRKLRVRNRPEAIRLWLVGGPS
jgi:DNA-binding CsgD family transcriptional regulator